MKLKIVVWAATVATATASPGSGAEMRVRYFKGLPTYVSIEPSSVAQIALPPTSKSRRIGIAVVVVNRGTRADSLGYENVSIHTGDGRAVEFLSYEELQHKARVRAGWTTFFASMAGGLAYYSASQSGYGSVGRARFYDPTAAQIGYARADALTSSAFSSIAAQLDSTLAQLDGSVLRTTTIDPGASFGGEVVFDMPKGASVKDLVVTVAFAGEKHDFDLRNSEGLPQASAADLGVPPHPVDVAPARNTEPPERTIAGPTEVAGVPGSNIPLRVPSPPASANCPLKSETDPTQNLCGAR